MGQKIQDTDQNHTLISLCLHEANMEVHMKKVLIFISFLCAIIPLSFRNVQAQGNSKQEVIIANEMLSPIPALSSSETMMVSLGIYHSSVLSSTGRVFTWGLGGYGQLGNSTTTYSHVPTDITTRFGLLGDDKIIQLSLGNFHSSALSSTGRVYTWGFNFYGQLGNNTGVDSSVPYEITDQFGLSGEDKIIQLSWESFIPPRFHQQAGSFRGVIISMVNLVTTLMLTPVFPLRLPLFSIFQGTTKSFNFPWGANIPLRFHLQEEYLLGDQMEMANLEIIRQRPPMSQLR
jgi:hypothetical protein